MDSARKRAEEALAAIDAAIGDADETTPERVSLAALGPALCDLIRATRALLASEPAKVSGSVSIVRSDDPPAKPLPTCVNCGSNFITPAPPAGAEVREAAEAKATALLGSARHYFAQGHPMREAIDEHLAALRATASPAPGSEGVREAAEAVCERLCGFGGVYYRRVAPDLVADIEALLAALRGGQKGGE